jgi:glycosyltransferase involved in cell wall biosynthesis
MINTAHSLRTPHDVLRAPCTAINGPARIRTDGKFFRLGRENWFVKGFSYGPFAVNSHGDPLPEPAEVARDFATIHALGGNAIRLYFPPPRWLLDEAIRHELRVFVDIPWEKHRCFFEDWSAQEAARQRVRQTARELGNHPAVFAISVVNEYPNDVVRFYGRKRVERFTDDLIDVVKQESPECLATFVNFPTTEFLIPSQCDFWCFNVYLHDQEKLGAYLDRLQHTAGNLPLVLGEYGIDSLREGEPQQAQLVATHIERAFRHGLAGSFVFSFTDDWFTGGHQIEDWAFGVTRRDRSPKPAAERLRHVWNRVSQARGDDLPKVSVVVCSYNGAATLEGCLHSLMRLEYPDYEVILVDDGSEDRTPQIAAQFPAVRYIRQPNRGLSVARNVGARAATGEIVAYTDSDCVANEYWLLHLMQAKLDQGVEAIGGPNIPPPSDGWIAKCVAASPGGPSHVMLDDREAEHIPGCNMAFDREKLLALGGFDPQFRAAGDDVDICWRFLDAAYRIGYAPGAMVWHHRRSTIGAYLRQQKGYGRAEAMVHLKHPHRFSALGRSRWTGTIYGEGAVGLPLLAPVIYHGRFGTAPFQTIYRRNEYSVWAWVTSLEWHAAALFLALLAVLLPPVGLLGLSMWAITLLVTFRSARRSPLPRSAPWWCRSVVWANYLLQPVVREWHRYLHAIRCRRFPSTEPSTQSRAVKRISATRRDLYWQSNQALGREQLLDSLVQEARRANWPGSFEDDWAEWDVRMVGDWWHDITVRTATEELGWPRRFSRARCAVHLTHFGWAAIGATAIWTALALILRQGSAVAAGLTVAAGLAAIIVSSRRRCLRAVTILVARAAAKAGLEPVATDGSGLFRAPTREVRQPDQRRPADASAASGENPEPATMI